MATKKVGVKVYGIKWDTDGEKVKLPTKIKFKMSDLEKYLDLEEAAEYEIEDAISELLSDEYEFCHDGFEWEWDTKKMTPAEEKQAKVDAKVKDFLKCFKRICDKNGVEPTPADWDDLKVMAYALTSKGGAKIKTYRLTELIEVNIDSWVEALSQLDDKPEFMVEVLKEADKITLKRWRQTGECPTELENEITTVANRHNYRFDKDGKIVSFDK